MKHDARSHAHHAPLAIGKLPNELLADLIQPLRNPRPELLTGPAVGEDCAILDLNGGWLVATTDPITGSDKEIGRLGIHVSLNDLASAGAEPVAVLVTLLCPPGTLEETVRAIMDSIRETAGAMHIALAGGHTEVTDAVTRTVLSVTALGRANPGAAVTTAGARPGDALVMTKTAALEGTAILAREREAELIRAFGPELVAQAMACLDDISVVAEGRVAARHGVHAMHDITEGGVLGAAWELCAASGVRAEIWADRIPVRDATRSICAHFGIDPFRLISSGSMLMACADGEAMVRRLADAGIQATVIGTVIKTEDGVPNLAAGTVIKTEDGVPNLAAGSVINTEDGVPSLAIDGAVPPQASVGWHVLLHRQGSVEAVDAPGADELYKVL